MRKLYVLQVQSDVNETQRGYGLWQGIRIRIAHSDHFTMDATTTDATTTDAVSDIDDELGFQSLFKAIGVEIELDKIMEWLNSDANDKGLRYTTKAWEYNFAYSGRFRS